MKKITSSVAALALMCMPFISQAHCGHKHDLHILPDGTSLGVKIAVAVLLVVSIGGAVKFYLNKQNEEA